jgi:putative acetyltransferase
MRPLRAEEIDEVAALFTETVHTVNANDYAPDQLAAWAPQPPDPEWWRERLGGDTIALVAVRADHILGFAALRPDGHLDLLYTRAQHLRQGVGATLLEHVEDEARTRKLDRLTAEVSVTARPFFDRAGFRLIAEQTVERRGVEFQNYRMEKLLRGGTPWPPRASGTSTSSSPT